LGKTPVETYEMLQTVCGNEALSCSNVFEWFKRFKDGREDLQDDPKSGRPSASRNVEAVANEREVVTREHRWAVRMMTVELNSNKETIRQIIHEERNPRKVRPTQTHRQVETTEIHIIPKLHPDLSR
jgi:transposase